MQDDIQSGRLPVEYLGLHRADVIRLHTDALRAEKGEQAAEIERLKNDDGHICGHMIAADSLRAENQKLREALWAVVSDLDAGGATLDAMSGARAALGKPE